VFAEDPQDPDMQGMVLKDQNAGFSMESPNQLREAFNKKREAQKNKPENQFDFRVSQQAMFKKSSEETPQKFK